MISAVAPAPMAANMDVDIAHVASTATIAAAWDTKIAPTIANYEDVQWCYQH